MHELGTVFYVIEQVEKVCKENDLTTVGSVTLEIGEVSGIIPMYIQDCWEWAKKRSEFMKDAELKIETLERHLLRRLSAHILHHEIQKDLSLLQQ